MDACDQCAPAGFHNASLYEALRPSISPLVALLRGEEEDKTRANAAGALGNLVRNSSQLCGELIKVRWAVGHVEGASVRLRGCVEAGAGASTAPMLPLYRNEPVASACRRPEKVACGARACGKEGDNTPHRACSRAGRAL